MKTFLSVIHFGNLKYSQNHNLFRIMQQPVALRRKKNETLRETFEIEPEMNQRVRVSERQWEGGQVSLEMKIRQVFKEFRFQSFTFHLFIINCLMWFIENLDFYFSVRDWFCVQYLFFAKFQPAISYHWEVWRILMASFVFRGWLMFVFNNFALNMLGYVIERQSRFKMIFIFYMGIMAGHLLSCCFGNPQVLTAGTSCGTIALLPIEICRFVNLRREDPLEARKRKRFLSINITSNFILNFLAVFGFDPVDWISHIGCIISGILCLLIFQKFSPSYTLKKYRKIRTLAIIGLIAYIYIMWFYVLWRLPHTGHGRGELFSTMRRCKGDLQ